MKLCEQASDTGPALGSHRLNGGGAAIAMSAGQGHGSWMGGGLLLLVSVALYILNTHQGIGIFADSTRYMGLGPEPYDAPLYPWILMLASLTGAGHAAAAKAIGLLFVSANTLLVWHLLVRATRHRGYAFAGTALVILAPQFVTLHSSAMSEPPFVLCLLLTIFAYLRYLETDSRRWLTACAIALSVATLARFTAPPLGAAIAICLLLNRRISPPRRLTDAIYFTAVSASTFLIWVAVSESTADRSIGRALHFYGGMDRTQSLDGLEALTAWLLPDQVPFAPRVILLCSFVGAIIFLACRQSAATLRASADGRIVDAMLPLVFSLFLPFYLAFMVLSTSLEANLAINGRYAFPAYVMTAILATILVADIRHSKGKLRLLYHALVAVALVVLSSHAVRSAVRSRQTFQTGYGYASLEWTNSPTIKAVKALPKGALIYSNGPEVISFILGRPAQFIPRHVEPRTGVEDPNLPFEAQVRRMRAALDGKDAYVVMFDKIWWRFYLPTEDELKAHIPLKTVAAMSDGHIYTKRPI